MFKRSKVVPIDIYSTIKRRIEEGKIKPHEIIEKEHEVFISNSATIFTRQKLNRLGCLEGRKVISAKNTVHMSPMKEKFGVYGRYKISFDYELFEKDFFSGRIDSDLQEQFFKAYKPKIFDAALKREMKRLMMPFYVIHIRGFFQGL